MITVDWDPSQRTLRQFAAVGGAVLAALATATHLRGGAPVVTVACALVALALAATGWARPGALRLPYVLLTYAVLPIGTLVSHLILLVLFYGVITPLGFLARLVRRDPLATRWERGARTYWRERRGARDPSSYLRQA
jgi:hypothetical protein